MKDLIKSIAKQVPQIRALLDENEALKAEVQKRRTRWLPGHFYSPIPDLAEVRRQWLRPAFRDDPILGVDLQEDAQIQLLRQLGAYQADAPFPDDPDGGHRYHYRNEFYSYADGIVLHTMLRHLRPRRLIEVGSGYSTALILDTNEQFLDHSVRLTFIEPYPARLDALLREEDRATSTIIAERVQDVPVETFVQLNAGDILLIDSSHVSKAGSDLNHLLFNVLPRLRSGVHVHFHDVFYPFDYPFGWIEDGVAWNEAYLLRAFLQYNAAFTLRFFTAMLIARQQELVAQHLPVALKGEVAQPSLKDTPGSSLWMVRN
jgi:hypothetical protein